MSGPALPAEWYYRRFQAIGSAQTRYLLLLLIITAYTIGLSVRAATTVSVAFLGLTDIPTVIVNAGATVVLSVLLLAFYGSMQAAQGAFTELVACLGAAGVAPPGMYQVDSHPNVADFLGYATFMGGKRTRLTRCGALVLYPLPAYAIVAWTFWLWFQGVRVCSWHLSCPLQPVLLTWGYRVSVLLMVMVAWCTVIFTRRRWELFRTGK